MNLEMFIDGDPKAQPRAKATRRGNFIRMYTPGSAASWKALIESACRASGRKYSGPLHIRADFFFPRPKSTKKAVWHWQKPDVDNLEKAVFDAMKDAGMLSDDCIVCSSSTTKRWQIDGKVGVKLQIEELEDVEPMTLKQWQKGQQ